MIKFFLPVIVLLINSPLLFGQIKPFSNLSEHQQFYWNPALNAVNEELSVGVQYWKGSTAIKEDYSANLFIQYPLIYLNSTLGVSYVRDTWGPMNSNQINLIYSYKIKLNEDRQKLILGIMPRINFFSFNKQSILAQSASDPNLTVDSDPSLKLSGTLGALFHTRLQKENDYFIIGASASRPLSSFYSWNRQFGFNENIYIYGNAAIRYTIQESLILKGVIQADYSEQNQSTVISGQAIGLFSNKVKLGMAYNSISQFGILAGMIISGSFLKDGLMHLDLYGMSKANPAKVTYNHSYGISLVYYFDLSLFK